MQVTQVRVGRRLVVNQKLSIKFKKCALEKSKKKKKDLAFIECRRLFPAEADPRSTLSFIKRDTYAHKLSIIHHYMYILEVGGERGSGPSVHFCHKSVHFYKWARKEPTEMAAICDAQSSQEVAKCMYVPVHTPTMPMYTTTSIYLSIYILVSPVCRVIRSIGMKQ